MTPLAVERSQSDGYAVLTVDGELDIATAPRMIAALNEALADMAAPLVVDLTSVVFMDSTGLALLMNARRRAMRLGQGFAIVCPGGPIARVFEIADMVGSLRVCPDRESARQAATQPA
ncbi:MAG TPA: STAS domain-containing protein [Thermoleophilaceae bacterium]|nr:STAS domain-containing protein [Thermoleophilaceae bacterium]